MILAQAEIRDEVAKGQIKFDPPLEERQWHEGLSRFEIGLQIYEARSQARPKSIVGIRDERHC